MPRPSRSRWVPLVLLLLTGLAVLALALAPRPGRAAGAGPASPTATASPPATATPGVPASASPAGPLRVVGLGDSVTSGEHCSCDDYVTGFGTLVQRRDGVAVRTSDDGESGSTSPDLAADLATDAGLRRDVARADVVVLTMGANDLAPTLDAFRDGGCDASCTGPEVARMGEDLGTVLDRVDALTGGRARVLVTTYWNVFTDGAVARAQEGPGYPAWSDALTRAANRAICAGAARHGSTCVDLYTPFKADGSADPTSLLGPDGDHPDAAGTALISEAVLRAYER